MKDERLCRANSVSVQVGNRLNIFKNDPFTQYRTNFRPDEKLDRTLDDVNMNCGVYLKSEIKLCLISNKQYWRSLDFRQIKAPSANFLPSQHQEPRIVTLKLYNQWEEEC